MNALTPISYEDGLKAQYAERRARLFGNGRSAPALQRTLVIEKPAIDKPAAVVTAVVWDVPPEPRGPKVLNMLAPPSSRFLIELASARHGIPVRSLMSRNRAYPIMAARADAMALVFQHTQSSYPMVGKMFNRDHTTVLSAVRKLGRNVKLVELRQVFRSMSRPKLPKPLHEYAVEARARRSALARGAIRQGYASGRSVSAIAADIGYKPRSVRVIASQMGLHHPSQGLRLIPPEQAEEYRFLTQSKCIASVEAVRMLGQ